MILRVDDDVLQVFADFFCPQQHLRVPEIPERLWRYHGPGLDFIQAVGELVKNVGRIDSGNNESGFWGTDEGYVPLDLIWTPNSNPVAGFEADGPESGSELAGSLLDFGKGETQILLQGYQALAIWPLFDSLVE